MSTHALIGTDPFNDTVYDDRYSGVRALWIKVVIRAVFDWVSYRDSDRLPQRKLAEAAEAWLFRPSVLFNGFENICVCLDVNPEQVRKWAMRMSRDQVSKIEHLERSPSYLVFDSEDVETRLALIG